MSTERGNVKKGAPKYQNDFAFKHNPKSKKTLKILSLPNEGLCNRCHEVVEWKKKYRKYKPLTTPKRCSNCQEKNVKHAYHILCINCARNLKVCAKCKEGKQIVTPMKTEEEKREQEKQLKEKLEAMSERERRAYNRSLSRDPNADPAEALARAQKQSKDSDSDDFDDLDDLDSGGENEHQEEKEEDDESEEDHIDAESDNEET